MGNSAFPSWVVEGREKLRDILTRELCVAAGDVIEIEDDITERLGYVIYSIMIKSSRARIARRVFSVFRADSAPIVEAARYVVACCDKPPSGSVSCNNPTVWYEAAVQSLLHALCSRRMPLHPPVLSDSPIESWAERTYRLVNEIRLVPSLNESTTLIRLRRELANLLSGHTARFEEVDDGL